MKQIEHGGFALNRTFLKVYLGTILLSVLIPLVIAVLFLWVFGAGKLVPYVTYGFALLQRDVILMAMLAFLPCVVIWKTVGGALSAKGDRPRSAAVGAGVMMALCFVLILAAQRSAVASWQGGADSTFLVELRQALHLAPLIVLAALIMVSRVFVSPRNHDGLTDAGTSAGGKAR